MTRDEFDILVQRLEDTSRKNPRLYNARVFSLVMLAYGYLILVLLGSFAILVGTIALVIAVHNAVVIKLALFLIIAAGGLLWAVVRGLWVKLDAPEGQCITREQAPKLFALLDELRTALKSKSFHHVLWVNDYNAAVFQLPRLGVFGWHRNYLLLGLPLMQSLTPDEFKAVLAHEFAHSSGGHGRFGNWLYRIRRSWDQIFEQIARQRTRGGIVLTKFIQWFWPIFNAHAFVLARANEYEADACSVRLAGADAASSALMRLPIGNSLLDEKFWPQVLARVTKDKEPPTGIFLQMRKLMSSSPASEDAARWIRQAFLAETNSADTHPCLKDRLRAMDRLPAGVERGEFPVPPSPPQTTAADFFLGGYAEVAAQQLSEGWNNFVAENWTTRHQQMQKLAAELAAPERPSDAPPKAEDLWTKALKLIELEGDEAALPVIEQILLLDPKHVAANFVRGRHYLAKDDRRGIECIENAVAGDSSLTGDACELLYAHYARTGQRDKLRAMEERGERFSEESRLAQEERANVCAADTFVAHKLSPEQIATLCNVFAAESEIGSAAVARKQVRHFPDSPCFVIGLRVEVAFWKLRSSAASQKLVNRVLEKVTLPGYSLVFVAEENLKSLGKKVFAVPGSLIYRRLD
jgi:Zn-dependent protease with chaperone function